MTAHPLELVRRTALANLIPPPRLPLSDWIERHLILPDDVSAQPGAVRLWPFQREIADAIGDPAIERVTIVKPVRVGFTTLLTGALASFVANEPAPVLALLPAEADCRDYMVSDIEPTFAASPVLAGLLSADAAEGGRNTLLSRRFPGGSLKVVAAKAPRNLRRHNARLLFIDEADAMLPGPEGAPIALAEKRTLSFANRKIVLGSTPTDEETSNVLRSYAASDRRVFEVPCPHCGERFELLWAHIQWPKDQPEDAYAACPANGCIIAEREKPAMVAAGTWRATAPAVKEHAGFRLNALVSLLAKASWGKLAAEFLTARASSDTLRVFVNTILAEGWRETADIIDESALAGRIEPFGLNAIPAEVLVITVGVDVQDDRLECSIVGWTRTDDALVLGHSIVWGSSQDDSTWAELDELLRTTWPHPHGGRLKVEAAIVDSGDGGITEKVYSFCFPRMPRRIWAGKGVAGPRPAWQMSKSTVKGGRLFIVGVDGIKTTILDRLRRTGGDEAPQSSIRLSADLEPSYFEQLASERRVIRMHAGQPVRRFERITGARAEALDCLVYAFSARRGVTINYDNREEELRGMPTPPRPSRVIESKWMNRGRA
ncbi:phage terminase large subunit family protein [Ancylobacter oerskovii]|uniref:Phage terminase large subunit family protein n=1 Tax=Ancylobacter oerskovii TaxID=459519 RepID=A0ABW4Z464_9HYPH|nr:phage terminase large subunit family protein [Ancylobacter oerskovii]MBS7545732.1 phage terminase large subunit family protein [Ancylobacter oerskovii]